MSVGQCEHDRKIEIQEPTCSLVFVGVCLWCELAFKVLYRSFSSKSVGWSFWEIYMCVWMRACVNVCVLMVCFLHYSAAPDLPQIHISGVSDHYSTLQRVSTVTLCSTRRRSFIQNVWPDASGIKWDLTKDTHVLQRHKTLCECVHVCVTRICHPDTIIVSRVLNVHAWFVCGFGVIRSYSSLPPLAKLFKVYNCCGNQTKHEIASIPFHWQNNTGIFQG